MSRQSRCPQGTVTFLLTDIEGSTWLWEQAPEAMAVAYQQHDAILQAVAAGHGGVVFKIVGDAFQLAFPDTGRAAAAAVEAQRRLHAGAWGLPRPFRVRMALHRCHAEPLPNGDYRTPALNRAGRLLAAGHGGQILLSADAAAGLRSLPDDCTLRDLGERRLRDLPRAERVYHLIADDLPSQFPPIETIDRRSSELPQPATRLIGRKRELASAQAALRSGERRLVTLTGPGGVGKSRLAIEIAAGLADDFDLGAHWISLAQVIESQMIVPAIATHFGITPETDESLEEALAEWVRDRDLLLVIDNCEHLLDGVAELAAGWLQASPRLAILATSRARLRLRAELLVPVKPLAVPEPGCASLDKLAESPSGALFLERVRSGGVVPADRDAPAIAAICRTLDGLPLALELAAARDAAPDFARLAVRLTSRLAELTDGPRDLPARQRALRSTIEWSYDRLTPEQQAVFRRFAVFVDHVTADEAATVCEVAPDRLARVLDDLVDNSLLTVAPGTPRRYGKLETIREFGRDALAAQGERETASRQHALHYAAVARNIEPILVVTTPSAWLEEIDRVITNLHAAMRWGLTGGDPGITLLIASALDYYWWAKGQWAEGLEWIERALAASTEVSPLVRCDGLRARGILLRAINSEIAAERSLAQAIALAREERERTPPPPSRDTERGDRSLVETVPGYEAIGSRAWMRNALASYGLSLMVLDRGLDALEIANELAALFDDAHDDLAAHYRLCQLQILACRALGRPVDPTLIAEVLRITEEIGGAYLRGGALQMSASVALDTGDLAGAAVSLAEALALQLVIDDAFATSELLVITARLAGAVGQIEPAVRFLATAEALAAWVGIVTFPYSAIDHADAWRMIRASGGAPSLDVTDAGSTRDAWRQLTREAIEFVTARPAPPATIQEPGSIRPMFRMSEPAAD